MACQGFSWGGCSVTCRIPHDDDGGKGLPGSCISQRRNNLHRQHEDEEWGYDDGQAKSSQLGTALQSQRPQGPQDPQDPQDESRGAHIRRGNMRVKGGR